MSRQGTAFDYNLAAELYLSRRSTGHTDYRRFATAAEAIRYAFEELRTRRSRSVRTRLSVRIDLASGDHFGSRKIALLEAIQARLDAGR